jgi:hypothetical protein
VEESPSVALFSLIKAIGELGQRQFSSIATVTINKITLSSYKK